MNKKWSKKDREFLEQNVQRLKDEEIAQRLDKTVASVTKYRQRLGIKKKRGRGICGLETTTHTINPNKDS